MKDCTFKLAARAQGKVSAIREIFQELPNVKEKRITQNLSPLIDLSIGQPHVPAHPEVMKKLEEMKPSSSSQGYSSAKGEQSTLESIVKLYQHYYPGIQYQTNEVMVTLGGSGALSNIFSILVGEKEDTVLTFEPYFAAYTGQVQEWGGTLQKIPTRKNNFRPTASGLEEALNANPNVKALILNYPNNPSGVSLTKEEAISLVNVLEKFPDVIIIIDDVYRDFNYREHVTVLDVAPHLKERCVVINSGAKGLLGAPGERIGMVSAHENLIKCMSTHQTNSISSVPYRTQAALRLAVESYLQNPKNDWLMNTRNEYQTNVETASTAYKKAEFTLSQEPDGAFYLLVCAKHLIGRKNPNTSKEIKNDVDIAHYFLHEAGVATIPGSGFGIDPSEGYLRISCANKRESLIEAADRMDKASRLLIKQEKLNTNGNLSKLSMLSSDNNEILPQNTLKKSRNISVEPTIATIIQNSGSPIYQAVRSQSNLLNEHTNSAANQSKLF